MEKDLIPIVTEHDLEYYEKRLNTFTEKGEKPHNNMLGEHFVSCKGKLVKVEICAGGCSKVKTGILFDVGEDFISIKTGCGPVSCTIPTANIHSVTFIHNNDRQKLIQALK